MSQRSWCWQRPPSEEPSMETVTYSRKKSIGTREAKFDGFLSKRDRTYTFARRRATCACRGGTASH